MGLIVDVYNVLHVWRRAPDERGAADVVALARLIARSRYAGGRVRLVCDGAPPGGGSASAVTWGSTEIIYAGAGRDADSLIERLLRQDSAARTRTVVSSDHRIQRAARRRKAEAVSSEVFLARIVQDAGTREAPSPRDGIAVPLDRYSVEAWVREFGVQGLDVPGAEPGARSGGAGSKPGAKRAKEQRPAEKPTASEPPAVVDPLLREALRHFAGRLDPADLDMERWLREGAGRPRRRE